MKYIFVGDIQMKSIAGAIMVVGGSFMWVQGVVNSNPHGLIEIFVGSLIIGFVLWELF